MERSELSMKAKQSKKICLALAGNPNCGKTTVFNAITGSHQHVGNYPGVTVEKKEGSVDIDGTEVTIIDLPGTYSLTAYSIEEKVTREVLAPVNFEEKPCAVINVIDAGSLDRGLFLAIQIRELGMPVILACNMMDEVRKAGMTIDLHLLEQRFGVHAVPMVGRTKEGTHLAVHTAIESCGVSQDSFSINYGPDLEPVIQEITKLLEEKKILTSRYPARWTAIKYLEDDDVITEEIRNNDSEVLSSMHRIHDELAKHLTETLETTPEAIISDYRYGYINSLLRGVVKRDDTKDRLALTDRIDKVLTHKVFGPLIMFGVMYFMFAATFRIGLYPQQWLEIIFSWLSRSVSVVMKEGLLQSMICDGIIGGVGGVLSFVPLIMIMFAIVSFLEDSGYMARMAYMLDRVMRTFGLHGASVMPYIVAGGIAGGCAIPGVMATRTMRSEKERKATMLTLPLMTCGAKIPVFLMLTAAFFQDNQAGIMFSLTLCGWIFALFISFFLRKTILKGDSTPFVMELPPYRLPTLRSIVTHTWERSWMYIQKAGTVILAISIILWASMTFPRLPSEISMQFQSKQAELINSTAGLDREIARFSSLKEGTIDEDLRDLFRKKEILLKQLEEHKNNKRAAELKNTIAGRLGTFIEPIFRPLGFDWRTDLALLCGITAKEAVLSTMATAYSIGDVDENNHLSLSTKLASEQGWSKAIALALMLFVLIYSPCLVTLIVLKDEAGGWRWVFFSMIFNSLAAYAVAFLGKLIGLFLWA